MSISYARNMVHIDSGDRTYLTDSDSYGVVTRTSFLGLKNLSPVVTMDDGTITAVCGKNAIDKVVNKTTGKNAKGESVEMPVDVKEVGPELLGSIGVSTQDQGVLFEKFMSLPKLVRRAKLTEWQTVKSDVDEKSEFLSTIVGELADDELYIRAQAHLILNHVDQEIRDAMLVTFMANTTHEQRTEMVIQWQSLKTSKEGRAKFLQQIYAMTLTGEQYINIEYRVVLSEYGVSSEKIDTIMPNFISRQSERQLDRHVLIWKRFYSSANLRKSRAKWLIKSFSK